MALGTAGANLHAAIHPDHKPPEPTTAQHQASTEQPPWKAAQTGGPCACGYDHPTNEDPQLPSNDQRIPVGGSGFRGFDPRAAVPHIPAEVATAGVQQGWLPLESAIGPRTALLRLGTSQSDAVRRGPEFGGVLGCVASRFDLRPSRCRPPAARSRSLTVTALFRAILMDLISAVGS